MIFLLGLAGDVELNPGPSTFLCPICSMQINVLETIPVKCDMCLSMYHQECSGLSRDDFNFVTRSNIPWICCQCRPNLIANNRLKNIEDKIDAFCSEVTEIKSVVIRHESLIVQLLNSVEVADTDRCSIYNKTELDLQVRQLQACQQDLISRMNDQSTRLDSYQHSSALETAATSSSLAITEQIKTVISEVNSDRARELNLIIFGVFEDINMDSTSLDGSDKSFVRGLIDLFALTIQLDQIELKRLGKPSSKPRPLVLSFANLKDKFLFYKNHYKLRLDRDRYKGVSISLDRSPEARKIYNQLRVELRDRVGKGEQVVIFRDKIVNKVDLNRSKGDQLYPNNGSHNNLIHPTLDQNTTAAALPICNPNL